MAAIACGGPGAPALPTHGEPVERFQAVGFVAMQFVKLTEEPWFRREEVELREAKVIGWKPQAASKESRRVVYKGPFEQVTDESGTVYPRGEVVAVGWCQAECLRQGLAAGQFTFLK